MLTIRKYVLFLVTLLGINDAYAQAPYIVEVKAVDSSLTVGMQSFAWGHFDGKLLIVGGRINGFHRTSDQERTFPTKFDNVKFRVIDLEQRKMDSADIPAAFLLPLRTTNMAYYQDKDGTLYIAGGYGSQCNNSDAAACYQTFPNLTAINVGAVIATIELALPGDLTPYMITTTDERMRVTGGSLEKIGDYFYLVFGQNYNSIYKDAVTGLYTEQIRRFKINTAQDKLSITNYDSTVTSLKYQGLSQFHRRDLNIFPTILPDGTQGIGALGGVFTKQDGPFLNPIAISSDSNGVPSTSIDTSFRQKFCLYDCARMLVYDPSGKNMYTTLFGGITDYSYDKSGNILPPDFDNFMPFFDHLSTVARDSAGAYTEYPQFAPALPGYIGSNAAFIPDPAVKTYMKEHFIIDYSKLTTGEPVRAGWIFGGIKATAQQSGELNPTFANNMIYEVWLTKNKPSAKASKAAKKPKKGKRN